MRGFWATFAYSFHFMRAGLHCHDAFHFAASLHTSQLCLDLKTKNASGCFVCIPFCKEDRNSQVCCGTARSNLHVGVLHAAVVGLLPVPSCFAKGYLSVLYLHILAHTIIY